MGSAHGEQGSGFNAVTEVLVAPPSFEHLIHLKLDFSAKLMLRLIRIGC
jgi:hypothetical protein